jgi:hypothetical protein
VTGEQSPGALENLENFVIAGGGLFHEHEVATTDEATKSFFGTPFSVECKQ